MDSKLFLQSQPWIRYISPHILSVLKETYCFHSILNGQCNFNYLKNIISFLSSTQILKIEILISTNDASNETTPGLYFIIDGLCYLVEHILITKLTLSKNNINNENNILTPTILFSFPGNVDMRIWLQNHSNIELLKSAIDTMNKTLKPEVFKHNLINTTKLSFNNNNNKQKLEDKNPTELLKITLENWLLLLESINSIVTPTYTTENICNSFLSNSKKSQYNCNNLLQVKDPTGKLYNLAARSFINSLLDNNEVININNYLTEIQKKSETKIMNYIDELFDLSNVESKLYNNHNNHNNNEINIRKRDRELYDLPSINATPIIPPNCTAPYSEKSQKQRNSNNDNNDNNNDNNNSNYNTPNTIIKNLLINNIQKEIDLISIISQNSTILKSLPRLSEF
jgi:hypothetical protein